MPLATVHLFSLAERSQLQSLLKFINSSSVKPLVLSKPIRWIIRPEQIDASALLTPSWDLLLVVEDNKASQNLITSILNPSPYSATANNKHNFEIQHHYAFTTGIPSRLTKDFLTRTNPALLHPDQSSVPELTGALKKPLLQDSSQTLSLSPDLQSWIGTSPDSLPVKGAVSMLNLLSFRSGMKESYLKYGAAFGETIGAKRGGNAKLVGNIVQKPANEASPKSAKTEPEGIWHEFALAHYPSLLHFADMLASEDYQSVNQKYRVPALGDTCILCTSEIEIEKLVNNDSSKAKL